METPWCQETADGLRVEVRVQPRSSATRIEGVADGRLKLRLNAPPVDGAANAAATAYLAEWLGVAKSKVKLIAGDKSREKRFLVAGDAAALRQTAIAKLEA